MQVNCYKFSDETQLIPCDYDFAIESIKKAQCKGMD